MTSVLAQYQRTLDGVTDVVDRVPADHWDKPSPCPDWTARQLLGHLIDAQRQVIGMLNRASRPPEGDPARLDQLAGPDPSSTWRDTQRDTTAALTAVDPESTVDTPAGPATVAALLGIAIIEPLVHAWDLAAAIDQEIVLDPVAVGVVLPGVLAAGDQLAATGMYGPPTAVPDDADPQDKLLAALGRTPTPTGEPNGRAGCAD